MRHPLALTLALSLSALSAQAVPGLAQSYASVKDSLGDCCEASFNGLYISGFLGGQHAETEVGARLTDPLFVPGADPLAQIGFNAIGAGFDGLNTDGIFGAVQIGYDREIHPGIVVGVYGEYIAGETDETFDVAGNPATLSVEAQWTVGAKLGMVIECCVMGYLTAGYASGESGASYQGNSFRWDNTGFTLGLGIETILGRGFSYKLDYQYISFNEETFDFGGLDVRVQSDLHQLRLGLNYRFDVHGPDVAVYK